jgi:Flp pilus assembly protein TadB
MSIVMAHVLEGVGYAVVGISVAAAARLRWPKAFGESGLDVPMTGLLILGWPALLCAAIAIGVFVLPGWIVATSMKAIDRRVKRRRARREIAQLERALDSPAETGRAVR